MATKRETIGSESELRDRVYMWMREYSQAVCPGPMKFALVSRRWAWGARRFGRPLLDILKEDERYISRMGKGGAVDLIARTEEQIEESRVLRADLAKMDRE